MGNNLNNLNTVLFPGTYILHVSRETLSCGGDRTLHLPQEVLFCLWTAHILLCHKVSKTPAGSKDITEKLKMFSNISLCSFSTSAFKQDLNKGEPDVVPEQCIDGHFLPWDALLQHVIGEGGEAEQGLQDGIHVASVAKVRESKRLKTKKRRRSYIRPWIW